MTLQQRVIWEARLKFNAADSVEYCREAVNRGGDREMLCRVAGHIRAAFDRDANLGPVAGARLKGWV